MSTQTRPFHGVQYEFARAAIAMMDFCAFVQFAERRSGEMSEEEVVRTLQWFYYEQADQLSRRLASMSNAGQVTPGLPPRLADLVQKLSDDAGGAR